ncbi:hypothetical protein M3Y95_00774400 [Aphelenchoides besseyi]|nr:hypothetical protein M3Y95_00774400 [Aphelenchoides besseyi]
MNNMDARWRFIIDVPERISALYRAIKIPDDDGQWLAFVPNTDGLHLSTRTPDHVHAIKLWLKNAYFGGMVSPKYPRKLAVCVKRCSVVEFLFARHREIKSTCGAIDLGPKPKTMELIIDGNAKEVRVIVSRVDGTIFGPTVFTELAIDVDYSFWECSAKRSSLTQLTFNLLDLSTVFENCRADVHKVGFCMSPDRTVWYAIDAQTNGDCEGRSGRISTITRKYSTNADVVFAISTMCKFRSTIRFATRLKIREPIHLYYGHHEGEPMRLVINAQWQFELEVIMGTFATQLTANDQLFTRHAVETKKSMIPKSWDRGWNTGDIFKRWQNRLTSSAAWLKRKRSDVKTQSLANGRNEVEKAVRSTNLTNNMGVIDAHINLMIPATLAPYEQTELCSRAMNVQEPRSMIDYDMEEATTVEHEPMETDDVERMEHDETELASTYNANQKTVVQRLCVNSSAYVPQEINLEHEDVRSCVSIQDQR